MKNLVHIFKKIKNSKSIVFLILFSINLLLWGKHLSVFVLNGDDVCMLADLKQMYASFFDRILNFSGQYRPLGRLFYFIYEPVKNSFNLIYLLHLTYFTFVQFLFFLVASKTIKKVPAILASIFIFANPAYYYHIFTIASDINLLILALLLIIVLLIKEKKYLFTLIPFFTAIFIKETFIVLLPLVFFSIYSSKTKKNHKLFLYGLITLITGAYLYLRFSDYVPTEDAYTYVYTLQKAKSNIGDIIAWIISHPRGLEFYFYGFRNPLNYVVDLFYLLLWSIGIYSCFKFSKKWFVTLFLTLLASVAPFVFLNRILLFYIDLPIIILSLMFLNFVKIRPKTTLLLLGSATIMTTALYTKKWIDYSFVGNANRIAKNYISTLKSINIKSNDDLCIINHSLGYWPTSKGRLVYFAFPKYKGEVISFPTETYDDCDDAILLENVGGEYRLLE